LLVAVVDFPGSYFDTAIIAITITTQKRQQFTISQPPISRSKAAREPRQKYAASVLEVVSEKEEEKLRKEGGKARASKQGTKKSQEAWCVGVWWLIRVVCFCLFVDYSVFAINRSACGWVHSLISTCPPLCLLSFLLACFIHFLLAFFDLYIVLSLCLCVLSVCMWKIVSAVAVAIRLPLPLPLFLLCLNQNGWRGAGVRLAYPCVCRVVFMSC
jgi:hypothetical protein